MFNQDSGTNTDFTFEADVQIVSYKDGSVLNDDGYNDSYVESELEDGLQKIKVKEIYFVIKKPIFSTPTTRLSTTKCRRN